MTDLKPSTGGDGAHDLDGPSEPGPANIQLATPIRQTQATALQTSTTKPNPANNRPTAPIKPAQPRAPQTAPNKANPPNNRPTGPIKPAQLRAPQTATPTKPAQPRAAQSAAPTKPGPGKGQPKSAIKPPQPRAPQTAAPTKPAQPNTAPSAAPTKPGPPKGETNSPAQQAKTNSGQPAAPTKPIQPSAAEAAAFTKTGVANAHAAAALIKPSQPVAQPAAPAKPAQPGAQAPTSTKPGPTNTRDTRAALVKANPEVSRPASLIQPPEPSDDEVEAAFRAAKAAAAASSKTSTAPSQPAPTTKPPQPSAAEATTSTKPGTAKAEPPPLGGAAQIAAPTQAETKSTKASAPRPRPGPATVQAAGPSEPSSANAQATVPSGPSPADTEPAAKPSKRRRVLPIVLASVAATLVAVLAVAAIFVNRVEQSMTQNLDREDLMPVTAPHPTKEQVATDALNFVVMGYDSREPSVERSSSLMILHLNAQRDQAYFITFPRNMWVSIPGRGNNRINAAYSIGGSQLAVSTLENLTDTQMDHAARVDVQGFARLTDEVGGVTVYNKTAFTSHGYDYAKGNNTVSGARALYFVGERRQLPRGDFDRAAYERIVVRAIIAKTLSTKIVTDPGRLVSVVSGAAEHLTVDKGLTNSKIRSTALSLRLSNKDVHLMKAPVSGKATRRDQRVYLVDRAKLGELRTALREDRVNEYLAKYPQG